MPLIYLSGRAVDVDDSFYRRFWSKVVKTSGCWPWIAARDSQGYGTIHVGGTYAAHRLAFILEFGDLPSTRKLDHLCHTRDATCLGGPTCMHRRCVNPAHLEPVTDRENALRGRGFSAANAVKTHCPQGHPYNGMNTYVIPGRAGRNCRRCNREAVRRYKDRLAVKQFAQGVLDFESEAVV